MVIFNCTWGHELYFPMVQRELATYKQTFNIRTRERIEEIQTVGLTQVDGGRDFLDNQVNYPRDAAGSKRASQKQIFMI